LSADGAQSGRADDLRGGKRASQRSISAVEKDVKNLSIPRECGIGRRAADTMAEPLRIPAGAQNGANHS
jgi:hypothetical protein